jgi:hypothetical protein
MAEMREIDQGLSENVYTLYRFKSSEFSSVWARMSKWNFNDNAPAGTQLEQKEVDRKIALFAAKKFAYHAYQSINQRKKVREFDDSLIRWSRYWWGTIEGWKIGTKDDSLQVT